MTSPSFGHGHWQPQKVQVARSLAVIALTVRLQLGQATVMVRSFTSFDFKACALTGRPP